MSAALDHIILPARDRAASAAFLARILNLPEGREVGRFTCLPLGNGVTIDVMETSDDLPHHLAFLVDDTTFDPRSQSSTPTTSNTGPIPATTSPAPSTIATAAEACTSPTPPATIWNSSPTRRHSPRNNRAEQDLSTRPWRVPHNAGSVARSSHATARPAS